MFRMTRRDSGWEHSAVPVRLGKLFRSGRLTATLVRATGGLLWSALHAFVRSESTASSPAFSCCRLAACHGFVRLD